MKFTSLVLFLVCLVGNGFVLACLAVANDIEAATPTEYIEKIYEDRQNLKRFELEWQLEIVMNRKHPQLSGSSYSYHGWYDHANDRFRVDYRYDKQSGLPIPEMSRYSYDGKEYRVIDDEGTLGYEHSDKGPEFRRHADSGVVRRLALDPRLFGVFNSMITHIPNYELHDLLEIASSTGNNQVENLGNDKRRFVFRNYMNVNCTVSYTSALSTGGMPVEIVTEAHDAKLKTQVLVNWQCHTTDDGGTIWFPFDVETRRWDGGELVSHERIKVSRMEFPSSHDRSLYAWKSMDLPDAFVVEHRHGKQKTMKQWDAASGTFGPWKPVRLRTEKAYPIRERPTYEWVAIIFSLSLGAVLLFIGIRRFTRK